MKNKRKPAIFLDRDGTLIHFRKHTKRSQDVTVYADAPRAVRKLNELGYYCIVITNQPDINRGTISKKENDAVHAHITRLFKQQGAQLHAIYTCPHMYDEHCTCRKPEQDLLKLAQRDFPIDMKRSWFIGDLTRDVETGRRAKLRTIQVETGDSHEEGFFKAKPSYTAKNLWAAARIIERERDML